MDRISPIRTADEYVTRYGGDNGTDREVRDFLAESGGSAPGTDLAPNLWQQLVHNPGLARRLFGLHEYLLQKADWTDRQDLRELVVQVANRELRCTYLHLAHLRAGFDAGLSALKLASLDFVRDELYSDEERLVIEFTRAVLGCSVTDAQFEQASTLFGERGALQLIVTISYWRWLAMVANVLAPRPRFSTGQAPSQHEEGQ